MMDTLYINGVFHTLRDEMEQYSVLGVEDGRICYLSDTIPPDPPPQNRIVDLGGLHAYPAMTDAHLHLLSSIVLAASSFFICEIKDNKVVPENLLGIEQRVRDYCAHKKPDDLVVANGYVTSAIAEHRLPTRQELDDWAGGRRVVVYNIDGHSSSLSTAMLEAVGIDPEGHDGILQGAEHEFRQGKVTDVIASTVGIKELARGVANFTNQCYSYGITRVCAMDGNGDSKDDKLTKLLAYIAGHMDLDVRLYPQYMDVEKARPFFKKMCRPRIGGCGDWEMDGAVGSHSAAFYEPYKDTGQIAECYYTPQQVQAAVDAAEQAGCQTAVHAIGNAAIDRILDALDRTKSKTMHRIEHFEFPTGAAVDRLIQNGNIAISVQPGFAWIDKRFLHSYRLHLEDGIANRQVPLKKLLDAGVCVCGSTDAPVQSVDPFLQMLGMMDFAVEGQSLSAYEALCTYTKNPARALGEEQDGGTLEVGKYADFFTTQNNLLAATKDNITKTVVRQTYVRGKEARHKTGTTGEFITDMLRKPKKI